MPDSIKPWIYVSLPEQWSHAAQVRSLLAQIPADASVSASRYLIAHIPNRRAILRFPALKFQTDDRQVQFVDYAAVDLGAALRYQAAFNTPRNELKDYIPNIDRLIRKGSYGMVDFRDGVVLLKQGSASNQAIEQAWTEFKQKVNSQLKS